MEWEALARLAAQTENPALAFVAVTLVVVLVWALRQPRATPASASTSCGELRRDIERLGEQMRENHRLVMGELRDIRDLLLYRPPAA